MESEYSSLLKNDTWDLVPPPEGKNVVGSRLVLNFKRDEYGSVNRFKARLVAQGYSQVKGVDQGGMKGLPIILCFELYYRSGLLT